MSEKSGGVAHKQQEFATQEDRSEHRSKNQATADQNMGGSGSGWATSRRNSPKDSDILGVCLCRRPFARFARVASVAASKARAKPKREDAHAGA